MVILSLWHGLVHSLGAHREYGLIKNYRHGNWWSVTSKPAWNNRDGSTAVGVTFATIISFDQGMEDGFVCGILELKPELGEKLDSLRTHRMHLILRP